MKNMLKPLFLLVVIIVLILFGFAYTKAGAEVTIIDKKDISLIHGSKQMGDVCAQRISEAYKVSLDKCMTFITKSLPVGSATDTGLLRSYIDLQTKNQAMERQLIRQQPYMDCLNNNKTIGEVQECLTRIGR